MTPVSASLLYAAWEPRSARPPHQRLGALLAAGGVGKDALARDTLGARNARVLSLHAALVGSALEAKTACSACRIDNEFVVPADAVVASPAPDPDATVRLERPSGGLRFRLPRMSDLDGAAAASPASVLARCCLDGGMESTPLSELEITELATRFEALDPAADVVVDLTCAGCGQALRATVDVATFVARDLDRFVEGLAREVDRIASAYGWSEEVILALPPGRRRRYLDLIAARTAPPAHASRPPRFQGRPA